MNLGSESVVKVFQILQRCLVIGGAPTKRNRKVEGQEMEGVSRRPEHHACLCIEDNGAHSMEEC